MAAVRSTLMEPPWSPTAVPRLARLGAVPVPSVSQVRWTSICRSVCLKYAWAFSVVFENERFFFFLFQIHSAQKGLPELRDQYVKVRPESKKLWLSREKTFQCVRMLRSIILICTILRSLSKLHCISNLFLSFINVRLLTQTAFNSSLLCW